MVSLGLLAFLLLQPVAAQATPQPADSVKKVQQKEPAAKQKKQAEDPTQAPTDRDARSKPKLDRPPVSPDTDITEPPIELDTSRKVEYTFSPEKARKEIEVGEFHMRRRNWAAATERFEEALKWNPKSADAWYRLGEAREKKGELAKSVEAYRKYLELGPTGKKSKDVQKAVERVERELNK